MVNVGILVFPFIEELDFVGPYEVLSYINKLKPNSVQVQLISKNFEPVRAFNGLRFLPDAKFEEVNALDVLIVPGGKGRLAAMHDSTLITFIQRVAPGCKFVTSVCTGAFLLAEAGLLENKLVTTHQAALEELRSYPTLHVITDLRVVPDGKIITSGGVSSGIDLGLYLLETLFDHDTAQLVARSIEYPIQY